MVINLHLKGDAASLGHIPHQCRVQPTIFDASKMNNPIWTKYHTLKTKLSNIKERIPNLQFHVNNTA